MLASPGTNSRKSALLEEVPHLLTIASHLSCLLAAATLYLLAEVFRASQGHRNVLPLPTVYLSSHRTSDTGLQLQLQLQAQSFQSME